MTDFEKFKPLLKDFIKFYYGDLENGAGGNLHIALDDGNLSQSDLWNCQCNAEKAGDTFGYFLATLMRHFSTAELEAMFNDNWWSMRDGIFPELT